jgi:catechol 2,3-dioxygenase-like lactoylglutathione lyase family enzyme
MNLNHVTLPSVDVAAGAVFYRLLGFMLIVDAAPDYVRLEAPEGGATLSLGRVEAIVPTQHRYPAVYLETPDLDAHYARLHAAGVVFDAPPVDQSWLWREAWLKDPDGNRVCLFWAGDTRLNPPWRVRETPE